jgi:phage/plasmid-associated DNA primase
LIPFDVTIPSEERDTKLGEKLKEEAGQILTGLY